MEEKKDETGHFSNGIQCAAMARDTNIRRLLPNSILV